MFIYKGENVLTLMLIYVDDIILTGSDSQDMENLITKLGSEFSLKDLGPLHYFLGVEASNHYWNHAYAKKVRRGDLK